MAKILVDKRIPVELKTAVATHLKTASNDFKELQNKMQNITASIRLLGFYFETSTNKDIILIYQKTAKKEVPYRQFYIRLKYQ